MESFYPLENVVQDYAWGDPRRIPELTGRANPEGQPQAELWMGAHPASPSRIPLGQVEAPLDEWIASDPENILGPATSREFGGLPFLFKLLAASRSLSIQAHPDKKTAEKGFAAEEAAGIPRDARERNYRDDNHKPEIIMAIEPFTAMIGFRSVEEISQNFLGFATGKVRKIAEAMDPNDETTSLKRFLEAILTTEGEERETLIRAGLEYAASCGGTLGQWIPRLAGEYPGDAGALAPLYLNTLTLAPGEALYQPARALHAYLEGFGVELMANSDNVLRGGLTPKHIDIPELLEILDFRSTRPAILQPQEAETEGWMVYDTPAREFSLSKITVRPGKTVDLPGKVSPRILVVLDGNLTLRMEKNDSHRHLERSRGASAFLPWRASNVTVTGAGSAAVASVGG